MRRFAILLGFLLAEALTPALRSSAQATPPPPEVAPSDIIQAFNERRVAMGYQALTVSPILMNTAQQTAEIMAANRMQGHIGDVRGRVWTAGYGGGDTPWATENFLIGPMTLEEIMTAWSDDTHMIPVINPNYCHIGVGIAGSDGVVYYVLHAAYTDHHACGTYRSPTPGKGTIYPTKETASNPYAEWIMPVQTVTPQANGWALHTVRQGQTLWAIAMAYGVKVVAIVNDNALSPEDQMIYSGQKLFIPITITPATATIEVTPSPSSSKTASISTPSPSVGAAQINTPQPVTATELVKAGKKPLDRGILITITALFGLGAALVMLGMVFKK